MQKLNFWHSPYVYAILCLDFAFLHCTGCLKAKSPILDIDYWACINDKFTYKVPF